MTTKIVIGLFAVATDAIGVAAVATATIPADYCNELATPTAAVVALTALAVAAAGGLVAVGIATYLAWPLRRTLVAAAVACALAGPWFAVGFVCAHRLARNCG